MADERETRIRERAYQIWEEEGFPDGREREHWAQAEREIDQDEPAPDPAENVPKTA